jgi:hypothetical protein
MESRIELWRHHRRRRSRRVCSRIPGSFLCLGEVRRSWHGRADGVRVLALLELSGLGFRATLAAEESSDDDQGYDEDTAAYAGADACFCSHREAGVRY